MVGCQAGKLSISAREPRLIVGQCARRLLANAALPSTSGTPAPKNLRLIDELATERVMATYSVTDKQTAQGRDAVVGWMGDTY